MIAKSYLTTILVTAFFSLAGGGVYSIYRMIDIRDKEISSLREELLSKHVEIAKINHDFQKQADEFHAFNSKRHEYEKSLINKYTVSPQEGNPCDNGSLDFLLRKSFSNAH